MEKIMYNEKQYNCFFELTLDIVGGKWKPIVLYCLGNNKVLRYTELKKCIPSISERMLTRTLRELQKDRIINREVFGEVPPRVEYSLTQKGEMILPMLEAMDEFGKKYFDEVQEIKKFSGSYGMLKVG